MSNRDDRLIDLAAALSDGAPIDWDAAESSAASDSERAQIRRMRLVHDVAQSPLESAGARSDHAPVHESLLHPPGAPEGDDAAPVTWGPLRVIEKIGRGRFGDVYRAWDPRLDREVALKLLRRRESDASVGSTFIEEGRLLAKIRHPNVVTVYGAERIDERVGVWMELVRGRTLEEGLTARGPMAAAEVAAIGADVCRALGAVHKAGLLHRDVKAQNVMRDHDGRVVLMDFGTGRESGDDGPPELAGTPLYLAPEVIRGGVATPQSDIYSVGVLLYHLATGSFPVVGRTLKEIRDAHGLDRERHDSAALANQPEFLREVVGRALSPAPAERQMTIGDLEAALVAGIAGQTTAPFIGRRAIRGRLLAWSTLVAVAIGATAYSTRDRWLSSRDKSPSSLFAERVIWEGPTVPDNIAAISTDGQLVAYVDDDQSLFVVRDLSTGAKREIAPRGRWFSSVAFSRDSSRIAYTWMDTSTKPNVGRLVIVPASAVSDSKPLLTRGYGRDEWIDVFDWSSDGRRIAIQQEEYQIGSTVGFVDADNGDLHVLKKLDWQGSTRVSISPDGRLIAYDRRASPDAPQRDVFVIPADGGDEIPIATGPSVDEVVSWSGDGRFLIFRSTNAGQPGLWAQTIEDGHLIGNALPVRANSRDEVLGLSAAGGLYVRSETSRPTIQVATVDMTTGRLLTPPQAPTALSVCEQAPMFLPDGSSLSCVSKQSRDLSQRTFFIENLATGVVRELPTKLSQIWTYVWSKDGRTVLARATDVRGRQGIYRIDASTGATSAVLLNADYLYFYPQWADEGTNFYYTQAGGGRAGVLYKRDLRTNVDRVILRKADWHADDGSAGPTSCRDWTVSPDQRQIACLHERGKNDPNSVWLVQIDSGFARQLLRLKPEDWIEANTLHWTADGRGVVINRTNFSEGRDARAALWFVPVDGSAHKLDLGPGNLVNERFALNPTDQRIAFLGGTRAWEIRLLERFLPAGPVVPVTR